MRLSHSNVMIGTTNTQSKQSAFKGIKRSTIE